MLWHVVAVENEVSSHSVVACSRGGAATVCRRGSMFQVPLGIFRNPAMPYMRVGSHLPIIVVLALVFVIPHDSSTRLNPDVVGADGYAMMPTRRRGLEQRDAFRKQQRPAKVLFRAARIAARKAAMGRVSWEVTMPLSPPPSPMLPSPSRNHSFTTVEELRDFYGPKQNWWGDYNARETRQLCAPAWLLIFGDILTGLAALGRGPAASPRPSPPSSAAPASASPAPSQAVPGLRA